ncbi:hypothetical protein [Candidatus Francisella endociliophora]|uniref:hypothetical protein n=1 Tax=Candidatus Francisella endociliophora TaxID=653937 RepID=UPI000B2C1409|nr:hypothetical protein [Francisella sp. FSC1006]
MKNIISKILISLTVLFTVNTVVYADDNLTPANDSVPLQLSVFKNFPRNPDVTGLRLNLFYGKSADVTGLNFSILGLSDVDNFTGLEYDMFFGANRVREQFKGVSFSILNWHQGDDVGANFGGVNIVNNIFGANFGLVNLTTDTTGLNWSAVNISTKNSSADIGLVNIAGSTTLFQFGFINVTGHIGGLQIGLLNFAKNGFLPVFPIINF